MAFRRSRAAWGSARGVRYRGYARKAWNGRAFSRGGFQAKVSIPWGLGVAGGWLAPRIHPMQDLVITTLAVLPLQFPMRVKTVAQGYVLGMILKGFIGGAGTGAITQSDFA